MPLPKKRPSSKKDPLVGSGGQRRKALQGRGPTPKATERTGHPAARKANAASKRAAEGKKAIAADRTRSEGSPGGGAAGVRRGRPGVDVPEYVAGRNPVVEALRARVPAGALHVAIGIEPDMRVTEAIKLAGDQRVTIIESSRAELDRFTERALHQGLALQVPPYDYQHPDDLLSFALEQTVPALVVALDGVTDPRNLGAIIRSGAAFGAHGVLVPERRAAGVTSSTWKASAGAASRLRVSRATNLTRTLKDYAKAGLMIVGLAADGDVSLDSLDLSDEPLVLVVGSEDRGLSRLVSEACDVRVHIPMAGGNESLNAGIAGAVALYEIARMRRRT
jgi:23S rRNA (guanosine2251-2'-O)-methyltransferase